MTNDATKRRKNTAVVPPPAAAPVVRPEPDAPAELMAAIRRAEEAAEEAQEQREAATVYQLPFWPDDRRTMPTDFLTSALFAAIHPKDARHLEDEELVNLNGYKITFRGKRLSQVHADVWQGIMHLARQFPQGTQVRFRARHFLRLIGRHTGKSQRRELRRLFSELCATCVDIHDTRNKQRFWGSLLPNGAARDEDDDTMFILEINRDLARVFNLGHVSIDWQLRSKLKAKPLQSWLQLYFATSSRPVAVADLHRLSGSVAPIKKFRVNLRVALEELAAAGGHAAQIADGDVVRSVAALPEGAG
ncbi:MAG: hypothetical protein EPN22_17600, partial [Nitrospirae bacterium]